MKQELKKPDIKAIQNQLIEKLTFSGWIHKLKGFVLSSEFTYIIEALWNYRENGKRFAPGLNQMFRAFFETRYDDLKVIFCFQDPYFKLIDGKSVADGLATSCSNTLKIQPTLKYIFDAVERTVYPGNGYDRNHDLSRWARQAALLLNTALSVEVGKPGSHLKLWEPFTNYLFDMLNLTNSGLIWVGFGANVRPFMSRVNEGTHYKIEVSHPASAAYAHKKEWDCKDLFNEVNRILMNNNNNKIIW